MSELTDDRLRQIVVALQGQVLPRRLDPTLVHTMATELLALRAAASTSTEAVGVKALEWRAIGAQWQADTSIGWYSIRPGEDPDFAADLFLSTQPVASYPTEGAAKAAAQADFERRIRSCLTPPASKVTTDEAEERG